MPRCRGSPALVTDAARSFPRVLGVGLPHTGTTTLHSLLLLLGCCFATHNVPAGFNSRAAQTLYGRQCANTSSPECASALEREFESWQCLSDNPWAMQWQSLSSHAPAGTRIVLTRFVDPLAYGISRLLGAASERRAREWALSWAPGSRADAILRSHARTYYEHVAAVRSASRRSAWRNEYTELCWGCGDNASTLVAKLRLPATAWAAASDGAATPNQPLPETPTLKQSSDTRRRLGRGLRERLERAGACTEAPWMCTP